MSMHDHRDYSLLHRNTFGIDACCRRFIETESVGETRRLSELLTPEDRPTLIIGGGSNILFTADYPGTVIHAAIRGIETHDNGDGTVTLRAGSGEKWDDIVQKCVDNGWHGAENLSLIPGEAGATAVQNIGAYGAEAADIIHCVEAVELDTGRLLTFNAAECGYGYRQSRFKSEWSGRYIVTHVTYRLNKAFTPRLDYGNIREVLGKMGIAKPTAHELRQAVIDIRREKLPDTKVEGNAGSFFKNPVVSRRKYERLREKFPLMPHYSVDAGSEKIPAGWLIEQCGWKGRTSGRAGVHGRQALVLVNRGGATGADILELCRRIRHDVQETFEIDLQPEVNIV